MNSSSSRSERIHIPADVLPDHKTGDGRGYVVSRVGTDPVDVIHLTEPFHLRLRIGGFLLGLQEVTLGGCSAFEHVPDRIEVTVGQSELMGGIFLLFLEIGHFAAPNNGKELAFLHIITGFNLHLRNGPSEDGIHMGHLPCIESDTAVQQQLVAQRCFPYGIDRDYLPETVRQHQPCIGFFGHDGVVAA